MFANTEALSLTRGLFKRLRLCKEESSVNAIGICVRLLFCRRRYVTALSTPLNAWVSMF